MLEHCTTTDKISQDYLQLHKTVVQLHHIVAKGYYENSH